jgi:hypothetical protein
MSVHSEAESKSSASSSSSASHERRFFSDCRLDWAQFRKEKAAPSNCDPSALFPSTMALLSQSVGTRRSSDQALVVALIDSFLAASEEKLVEVVKPYFNPIRLLPGVASVTGGRTVARALVQMGQDRCLQLVSEAVGLTAKEARFALSAGYDGPFRVFAERGRWKSMEVAANASTENAVGDANSPPVLKSLHGDLKTWFAPVTPTQDSAEGTLKAVKNTHPAQRGSIETVCRVVRMRYSRQQCLQEVPLSVFPYTRDRGLWIANRR